MDSKYIEQLLERYWRCETSLKEEEELRSFFAGGEVPAHLLRYKDWFVHQRILREQSLGEDFDRKVLAEIGTPVVKARRLTMTVRLMPLIKAAAVVALILSLGGVVQRSVFEGGDDGMVAPDTIGQQISAPSVALSGGKDEDAGKQVLDSLGCMEGKKKEPLR